MVRWSLYLDEFLIYVDYCQITSSVRYSRYRVTVAMVHVVHLPYPQWPKMYASMNLSQCYTHSYCPYIDTDDLQQMTPVCI